MKTQSDNHMDIREPLRALLAVADRVDVDAFLGTVAFDILDHPPGVLILVADTAGAGGCRHDVVHDANRQVGPVNLAPLFAQAGKGVGRDALVYQVTVDEKDRPVVAERLHDVGVPDLLIQRLPHATLSPADPGSGCNALAGRKKPRMAMRASR